ncbi:MAG: response regulator, partial [Anaerolineae bacterium]
MTPRVLLVEDNPGHAHLLREMLTRTAPSQFELTHVQRLGEALQCLDEAPFDLVLLDLSLPDSWGLETFAQARAQVSDVPIIVLSSLDDESLAAQAAREGAQDYLVKGQVDGPLLVRAMHYAVERSRAEALIRAQRDLGLALGAAAELDQILRMCVETAIRVSGMDCGGVYLVDKETGDIDLAFHQGLSPQFVAS